MPKVNYISTKATRRTDAINQVNEGVAAFLRGAGVSAPKLGDRWSKGEGTAYKRLKNPEAFTLAELIEISTLYDLHCNIELLNGSTITKISW